MEKFPVAVYTRGSYPEQIDHVGWLSKVVADAAALEAAIADGWRLTMDDPPAAEPDPSALEPRRLGRRARRE